MDVIKDQNVIQILKNMLNTLDHRLVDHGERVAFLCMKMMRAMHKDEEQILHVAKLALFHDIGAYKTDEVDAILGFETNDVWEHAIYGYLFLSTLSPLKENSDCILYHHMPYLQLLETPCSNKKIASLIHLCDRIDVASVQGAPIHSLLKKTGFFDPEQVDLFCRINKDDYIQNLLSSGEYRTEMQQLYASIHLSEQEKRQYLEMLAYSIDFNSEFTVFHTIMTTSLAVELGKQFQFDQEKMQKLYYGALLHDIGKGAIPIAILEKRGALDEEEMRCMRSHVLISEAILDGYVDEDILHMAIRHHEKLDGSGYPYHLRGDQLRFEDRIVAIADILSALLGKRSYKEEFPVPKVIDIIQNMAQNGTIDETIVQAFVDHHSSIISQVQKNTEEIRILYQGMQKEYLRLSSMLQHKTK